MAICLRNMTYSAAGRSFRLLSKKEERMSERCFSGRIRSRSPGDASRKWTRSALALPLILIVLSGTGCLGWGAHGGVGIVPANIRNSSGEHLRITRTDSSRVALRRVAVAQDTLFGTTLGILGRRVAIPLRDIAKVERQKFTKASAGILAVAIIALAALAWEVSQLEWGDAGFGGWSGSSVGIEARPP